MNKTRKKELKTDIQKHIIQSSKTWTLGRLTEFCTSLPKDKKELLLPALSRKIVAIKK